MTRKLRKSYAGPLLMVLCACCMCVGQFIWKCYEGLFPFVLGFVQYGLGALAMLCAYRFGNLSTLQPINSVSYVIATILGSIFFQEAITSGKIIGILLIMVGVILLTRGEVTE